MFRRTKSEEAATPAAAEKTPGGKGRPTPSRKEAEAAAKARAKGPQNKKEAARLQRARRAEQNAKVRQGMRTGEERYLPARDKGPVRRFVRDLVDSRLCMAEFLLPMLVLILVAQPINPGIGNTLWSVTILLVGLDTMLLLFKLRRELKRRFAGQSTRGATGYALLRAMQLRFLRLPKPQVKLGTKLPDQYR
ncbi:MAG: DUF3043 domain-containing protein [Nocardioidaceae bacterium]